MPSISSSPPQEELGQSHFCLITGRAGRRIQQTALFYYALYFCARSFTHNPESPHLILLFGLRGLRSRVSAKCGLRPNMAGGVGRESTGQQHYFTSLLDQYFILTHRHTEIGNNRHHLILDSVVDPKG